MKINQASKNKYINSLEYLTYNLNSQNTEDFYLIIKNFSDLVLKKSKISIGNIIQDYSSFLEKTHFNSNDIYIDSYYEEYVLELLYFGILWKLNINKAINMDPFYQNILVKLTNIRNAKYILDSPYKKEIDEIRGLLTSKFLDKINNNNNNNSNNSYDFKRKIAILLNYLEATGDYKESLKHLNLWKEFFSSKCEEIIEEYLNSIILFVDFFENLAYDKLHEFTANVDNFLNNHLNEHIDNEDIFFCGRYELEYHINLFAAEIMNRIYQKEFKKREKIAILLPVCMRVLDSNQCSAIEDDLGLKCAICSNANVNVNNSNDNINNYNDNSNKCNVGKIAKELRDDKQDNSYYKDISVYIVSHSSSFLSNLSKEDEEELGIVGVACINNLIEGGWKISSHNIPPQCVILDYVGCKNHWTSEDILTDFNLEKLLDILF